MLTRVVVDRIRIPLLVGIAAALGVISLRSWTQIAIRDTIPEALSWTQYQRSTQIRRLRCCAVFHADDTFFAAA